MHKIVQNSDPWGLHLPRRAFCCFSFRLKFCDRQWKSHMSFSSWLWHLLIQYLNIFNSFVTRFTFNLLFKSKVQPSGTWSGTCFAHSDSGNEVPSLPTPVLSPQSSTCQSFCQPGDDLINLLCLCDKLCLFLLLTLHGIMWHLIHGDVLTENKLLNLSPKSSPSSFSQVENNPQTKFNCFCMLLILAFLICFQLNVLKQFIYNHTLESACMLKSVCLHIHLLL